MDKISVIVPIYNVEQYVKRCIDSILAQSYTNIEIVIVNDCTPDNSMKIIHEYNDERIVIYNHETNKGSMRARETGFKNATGDYICFCDSDDWLPQDSLQKLYTAIKDTQCDIVVGDLYIGTSLEEGNYSIRRNKCLGNTKLDVYKSLLQLDVLHSLWGKLYTSRLFKDYDYIIYDNFCNSEDAMLFYQIMENTNSVHFISNAVYFYYDNLKSTSKSILRYRAVECMLIATKFIKSTIEKYESLRDYLDDYLVYTSFWWILLGSHNYQMTSRLFKEFDLQYYISPKHCFNRGKIDIGKVKILIKTYLHI